MLYPDMIQAFCFLNQIPEALNLLLTAYKKDYHLNEISSFYMRLLLADGQEEEAKEIGKQFKGLYKKIKTAWEQTGSGTASEPAA